MDGAMKRVSILELELTKSRPDRKVGGKPLLSLICNDRLYQLEESQV